MSVQSILGIEAAIGYIESHLEGRLELGKVAEAVHYSKYHLHRQFSAQTGMTIHDYIKRRQLTEGARLLSFSRTPMRASRPFHLLLRRCINGRRESTAAEENFIPCSCLFPCRERCRRGI